MASITNGKDGRRTVQFVAHDGKRRSIRLGKTTKRAAEVVKLRVELIMSAKLAGHALDDETCRWLAELPDTLHGKLAAVGLVPGREAKAASTVGVFLDAYINRPAHVKPATREVWGHTARNLRAYFGDTRQLATITESDAEDFKLFLFQQGLAPTTVSKRLQFARSFFKGAIKRKLIANNPFAEVSAIAPTTKARQHFVSRADTEQLLTVCDLNWKVIVALCRFGGLRCPSEVLSLRWADIDWEEERIEVRSPKTEHHVGKGSRTIPLFPELRKALTEALNALETPAADVDFVVPDRMHKGARSPNGWKNCNLRTQFERLVKRAGLKKWPRLFHNLRASRETELARDYPLHVVTAWLGNTPKIALRHYLQVTEVDFAKAAERGAKSGAEGVQNAVQQRSEEVCKDQQELPQVPNLTTGSAERCLALQANAIITSGEDRIRTCGTV